MFACIKLVYVYTLQWFLARVVALASVVIRFKAQSSPGGPQETEEDGVPDFVSSVSRDLLVGNRQR